jgi:hypothetical protein
MKDKYTHDEQVVDAVMGLMAFLWFFLIVSMIGLAGAILKGILMMFGIDIGL